MPDHEAAAGGGEEGASDMGRDRRLAGWFSCAWQAGMVYGMGTGVFITTKVQIAAVLRDTQETSQYCVGDREGEEVRGECSLVPPG